MCHVYGTIFEGIRIDFDLNLNERPQEKLGNFFGSHILKG